ncbi:MAG: copper resistance CopC/CopD family protein [Solirubrobacterales bacterium]
MKRRSRATWAIAVFVLVAALIAPAGASAHAQLEQTEPSRDATVAEFPQAVSFTFSEPVEANFGAVRVYSADGDRVDDGRLTRADGDRKVAVGLRAGTGRGTFTATYRVVSADSHPVSGGFVFHVGESSRQTSATVAELVEEADSGPVTDAANTVMTFLGYAALAFAFGGLVFLKFVLMPAASRLGHTAESAIAGFRKRGDVLITVAVIAGVVSAVGELLLQGAIAAGQSLWSSLNAETISSVVDTRSGTWMAVRVAVWVAIALTWLFSGRRRGAHTATAVLLVLLAVASELPALVGHAGATGPRLLTPIADFIHVAAASIWIGGLAAAVIALPAATAVLVPRQRSTLLVDVFARFSPLALGSVILVVASGIVQSVVHLTSISELIETAFGRAILAKALLLSILVGIAAYNRQIALPRLRRQSDAGESPGVVGTRIKRALSAEVLLAFAALAVASMLVGYSPTSAAQGPFSETTNIGPVEMQLTVDPASTGVNELHVYLLDPKTAAAFDDAEEFKLSARLDDPPVGPIELDARKAGPGHYLVTSANFAVGGDWQLNAIVRVSDFDQYEKAVEFTVR